MRSIVAMFRADLRSALTYRFQLVLSIVGILVSIVPIFFISGALQPLMAESIRNEGAQYFGFIVVGTVTFLFISGAVSALPAALSGGIRTGTLEALLSTPASVPTLLSGLISYNFAWISLRTLVMLGAATVLGAQFVWSNSLLSLVILLLIVLAYLGFGVLAAALVLAFRTTGPFTKAVLSLSGLLGGVYYPTSVIPSWIHELTVFVPLTYGLRALRRAFMEGAPLASVAEDVVILGALAAVLLVFSLVVFQYTLQHAKKAGTLAQY
jgi:ABC-2 type transport system permease protein